MLGEDDPSPDSGQGSEDLPPAVTEFAEGEFPTEDMDGVTLMKVGGPSFGKGSPKEGDPFASGRPFTAPGTASCPPSPRPLRRALAVLGSRSLCCDARG